MMEMIEYSMCDMTLYCICYLFANKLRVCKKHFGVYIMLQHKLSAIIDINYSNYAY